MNQTFRSSRSPAWTTRNVVLATMCVAGIGLAFILLYRLRTVVFLVALAVVLGTAIRPAVNGLQNRGVLRPVGVFTVYMILALSVFGFMVMIVPLVADQGMELARNVPEYYENLRAALLESRSRIFTNLALQLPANLALFPKAEPTAEQTLSQVGQTYSAVFLVARIFLGAIAVLLVGFYWALEGDQVIRTLLRFVPARRRAGVRDFFAQAERKLGGFIRGQAILSVTVGATALIAYTIIGLPFAFLLAILAGIFEMVPFLGPVLGAIPALLVALSYDPATAVWVLVATGIIQFAENVWLVPRIMNHSMGVNPIVIMLSLVTFSSVLGFAGAVLALPLAALIQLVLDRLTANVEQVETPNPEPDPTRQEEIDSILMDFQQLLHELEAEQALE